MYTLALLNHNIYGCHVRYFKVELTSPLLLHKYLSNDCNLIKPLKQILEKYFLYVTYHVNLV